MSEIIEKPKNENVDKEGGVEKRMMANLLTDYEMTLNFMKAIEGPGWLEDQPQGVNVKGSLEYVMN